MPYVMNPTDDVRIYYEVTGEGPPLVLHHGGTGRICNAGLMRATSIFLRTSFAWSCSTLVGMDTATSHTMRPAYIYERWVE